MAFLLCNEAGGDAKEASRPCEKLHEPCLFGHEESAGSLQPKSLDFCHGYRPRVAVRPRHARRAPDRGGVPDRRDLHAGRALRWCHLRSHPAAGGFAALGASRADRRAVRAFSRPASHRRHVLRPGRKSGRMRHFPAGAMHLPGADCGGLSDHGLCAADGADGLVPDRADIGLLRRLLVLRPRARLVQPTRLAERRFR